MRIQLDQDIYELLEGLLTMFARLLFVTVLGPNTIRPQYFFIVEYIRDKVNVVGTATEGL